MSLTLDNPAPTLDGPAQPAPADLGTDRPTLPSPSEALPALRNRLDASLPPEQASTLVAASALTAVGDDRASGYAADVVRALGLPDIDPAATVAAARSYLDGGGAVPDGLDEAFREPVTLAQSLSLTRVQRADFSLIAPDRQAALGAYAEDLVLSRATPVGSQSPRAIQRPPQIDYYDLRDILIEIRDNPNVGDLEKAYVWNEVAQMKGNAGLTGYSNARVTIVNNGIDPDLIDDHPGRAWNTSNHAVVPFTDGYHGFGGNGMGNVTWPDAVQRIRDHERGIVFGIGANPGDAEASMASVAAFHAWRDAPQGDGYRFREFADAWIRGVMK